MNVNDTVVCLNNVYVEDSLTVGKSYRVLDIVQHEKEGTKFVRIRDDNGYVHHEFKADRFDLERP